MMLLTRQLHVCFINSTFISSTKLKLAINPAIAEQNPETETLLFENYWLSLFILSKADIRYSEECAKLSVSVLMRLCD